MAQNRHIVKIATYLVASSVGVDEELQHTKIKHTYSGVSYNLLECQTPHEMMSNNELFFQTSPPNLKIKNIIIRTYK